MKPVIHPSTLGVQCPRYHYLHLKNKPPQVNTPPDSQFGTDVETAVVDALMTGKPYCEMHGILMPVPTELTGRKWNVQHPIRYETDEYLLSGYVDLYNEQENWLVDVKSSYDVSVHRWIYQLSAYAIPFWGDNPPRVSIWYARWGQVVDIDPLPPEQVDRRIRNILLSATKPREPRGKGEPGCFFCEYAPTCKEKPDLKIDKDPKAYIAEFYKVQARYQAMRAVIADYTSVFGNISNGQLEAGYFPTSKTEYSPELWDILIARGINPVEKGWVSFKAGAGKKIIRYDEELGQYISKVPGKPRFAIKQLDGGDEEGEE